MGCTARPPGSRTELEIDERRGTDMRRRRRTRWASLAIVPVTAAFGCGDGATTTLSTDLGSGSPAVVELGVGQSAAVDGLEIRFAEVAEDSRCALDVTCVWEGNGAVVLQLSSDGTAVEAVTVNTTVEPRSVERGGLAIRIAALEPQPVSTVTIDPEDYRVELEVSRTEPR